MSNVISLLCVFGGLALVIVALGQSTSQKKKNWIWPIVIAVILAIWNFSFALFYLLIVWILRLDPKTNLSHLVTDKEKKICERNYKWLRNSSFITLSIFFILLFVDIQPAVAAMIPFVFHIPLIRRLKTENLFVFRHTQQSLLLLIARAGTATIIFSLFSLDSSAFWIFVLVNGSLWLFGTNWEIKQVLHNDCWLMQQREEAVAIRDAQPVEETLDGLVIDKELKDSLKTLDKKGSRATKQKSLDAFRTGTPEARKRAVLVLSELGEVEKF